MSAREWQPGDVAMVTRTNGEEVIAMWAGWSWHCSRGGVYPLDMDVTPRRLVVIDPEDVDQIDRLLAAWDVWGLPRNRVRESMQAALRSLTAPPKPEEPTGLGAVVEDVEGNDWHRTRGGRWLAGDGLRIKNYPWGSIDAAKVLSEGVEVQP